MTKQVEKTELVAPNKKKVKLQALKDIIIDGQIIPSGNIVEVEDELAQQFIKPILLHHSHDGERSDTNAVRHQCLRAKIIED